MAVNGEVEKLVRTAVDKVREVYDAPYWRAWARAFIENDPEAQEQAHRALKVLSFNEPWAKLEESSPLKLAQVAETQAAMTWARAMRHGDPLRAHTALAGRHAARAAWAWLAVLQNRRELERLRTNPHATINLHDEKSLVQLDIDLRIEAELFADQAMRHLNGE